MFKNEQKMSKSRKIREIKNTIPLLKPYIESDDVNAQIDACFKSTRRRHVLISGPPGSGKTTTCVGYIHSPYNKNQVIMFLNAYIPEKLDFEYRQFAYEHLDIRMQDRNREELIAEVNEQLNGLSVLFIFDDVRKLKHIDAYLNNLPRYAQVIVTSSNLAMRGELAAHGQIHQELLTLNETHEMIRAKLSMLENPLNDAEIDELVRKLEYGKDGGVLPGDVEKCCAFFNTSSSNDSNNQDKLKFLTERGSIIHILLDYIRMNKLCNTEILVSLSMLDADMIPLKFFIKMFEHKVSNVDAQLYVLENYTLIQIDDNRDIDNKYIRLGRSTSEALFEWSRSNIETDRLRKIGDRLLHDLNDAFYSRAPKSYGPNLSDKYLLLSSRVYFPSVYKFLHLDIDKNVNQINHLNLYYKLAQFMLEFMRNPTRALDYLNHISRVYENDILITKTFSSQVSFVKGLILFSRNVFFFKYQ